MLILPLDHPEPFAATLGVMLYPGEEAAEYRKARAFAVQYLASPIRQLLEAGGSFDNEVLVRLITDTGERLDDLDKRWWGGTATGELFKALFILAHTEPALASWSNAIRVAESTAAKHKQSGARSALWEARSRFLTVARLWGAWSVREGRFSPRPEVGYDGLADFQSFLAESEILRRWGQSWHMARAKAEPPLPDDVWLVPSDWQPPARQPDWPDTGKIPDLALPEHLLQTLRPAGRPKSPA